jgi:putative ABC transport system ATP-binding protein
MAKSDAASRDDLIVELADVHLKLASAAGPVNILRGIDLTVRRGETVSVVGPSGSGKSTMMMIMAGLERPTSGLVNVAGHDLGRLDEDRLARFRRDHVGIVFQAFHLIPTMTALENVAIPLEFAGRADAFERAHAGLEAVGLKHRTTHYPGQLSGGEQQRVAIARALATGNPLIVADEPTGDLDFRTGVQILQLLREQAEAGRTVLVVTHNREISRVADRVIELSSGRIASDGPPPGGRAPISDLRW